MVEWYSLTPLLDQQPTTPALKVTFSAMETTPVLVKLMGSGLEIHPFVNVRAKYLYIPMWINVYYLSLQ